MFVKVYEYHIKKDKEADFIRIQEKSSEIYKKHLSCEVKYLKSINDETLWMEISEYSSEKEYLSGIQKVNKEPMIKELFSQFQACLDSDKQNIKESDYVLKLRI